MKSTSPVPSCVCSSSHTLTLGPQLSVVESPTHLADPIQQPNAPGTTHLPTTHPPPPPPHPPPPPLPSIPSTLNYSFLFLLLTCPGPKTPESNKHRGLAFTCSTVHSLLSRRVLSSQFVASSVSVLPFRTRLDDWVKSRQENSRGTRLTNSGDANSLALLGVLPVHPLGSKERKKCFPFSVHLRIYLCSIGLVFSGLAFIFLAVNRLLICCSLLPWLVGNSFKPPALLALEEKRKHKFPSSSLCSIFFFGAGEKITFYFYFLFY